MFAFADAKLDVGVARAGGTLEGYTCFTSSLVALVSSYAAIEGFLTGVLSLSLTLGGDGESSS